MADDLKNCEICKKIILTHDGVIYKINQTCKFECPHCPTVYTRWYDVKRHIVKYHYYDDYHCPKCGMVFLNVKNLTNSDHADKCFRATSTTLFNLKAGVKRFVCVLCGHLAVTIRGVGLHVSRKHKNHTSRQLVGVEIPRIQPATPVFENVVSQPAPRADSEPLINVCEFFEPTQNSQISSTSFLMLSPPASLFKMDEDFWSTSPYFHNSNPLNTPRR